MCFDVFEAWINTALADQKNTDIIWGTLEWSVNLTTLTFLRIFSLESLDTETFQVIVC